MAVYSIDNKGFYLSQVFLSTKIVICFTRVRFVNHEMEFMRKFGDVVYNRKNGLYNHILYESCQLSVVFCNGLRTDANGLLTFHP